MDNEKNLAAAEAAAQVDLNENVETVAEAAVEPKVTEAEMPETEAAEEEKSEVSMDLKDMISSIVIALFGLFVLGSGIHMSLTSQQMSDTAWYGTPGILPIIIGFVLTSLSIIMFVSAYRKGERINKELCVRAAAYLKSKKFLRLAFAIGMLAVYVFVLFRFIPFLISTFIYLGANMIFFREKNYPIWKLLIISAVFTVALYLFFGEVAGVPLP